MTSIQKSRFMRSGQLVDSGKSGVKRFSRLRREPQMNFDYHFEISAR